MKQIVVLLIACTFLVATAGAATDREIVNRDNLLYNALRFSARSPTCG